MAQRQASLDEEIESLGRCLIPMLDDDSNGVIRKLVTLIFVSGWVVITVLMTLNQVQTVQPQFYGIYTAIVFYILGKNHDLELKKLLGDG